MALMPASFTFPVTMPEKRAAQIGRQLMRRLFPVELERPHRLVGDLERLLEIRAHGQQPVEVV